jgi:hypothetical protein
MDKFFSTNVLQQDKDLDLNEFCIFSVKQEENEYSQYKQEVLIFFKCGSNENFEKS